jgi:hypothetical protein
MPEYLDQESKLERRALRKANELFLQRLQAEWRRVERNRRARDRYNAEDDFAKSIDEAYSVIRERVANGGPGWTPP